MPALVTAPAAAPAAGHYVALAVRGGSSCSLWEAENPRGLQK